MRCLVTGAGGFAGSHLVEYLLGQNLEIIALVKPEDDLADLRHLLSRVQIAKIDVRDGDGLSRFLSVTKPKRIYHLAALSSPVESLAQPALTYEVNFGGTLNLLGAWHRQGWDSRFLYVSSAEVYGHDPAGPMPLDEEGPFRPSNPYATSKAAAELLAWQFYRSYTLPVIRARPFNHTGPRQSAAFVCSSLARQFAEIDAGLQPPTVAVRNLHVRRDFTDVRDIVRGYYLLLEQGRPGEVYQLCSGLPVSIECILNILSSFISKKVHIIVDESKVRPQEAVEIWGSPAKAREAAGWAPQYPLETTLRDLKECWERSLMARA